MKRLLTVVLGSVWATAQLQAMPVSQFLPQGSSKDLKELRVDFAQPVVRFGDPFLPAPVLVQCDDASVTGQGRWLDSRRWLYAFTETPGPGLSCVATANPEFRDLQQQPISGQSSFQVNTGGPSVVERQPYYGTIAEDQAFALQFDAPVDPVSLQQQSYCAIEGLGERVPVRVLEGQEKQAVLQASYFSETATDLAQVLQCQRSLPAGAEVSVHVQAGVLTQISGRKPLASAHPYRMDFTVQAPFSAYVSCTREKADAPCTPVADVYLQFSTPVQRQQAQDLRLLAGDKVWQATLEDDDDWLNAVHFKGPFPEQTRLQWRFPEQIRDDAGRVLDNQSALQELGVETGAFPPLIKFVAAPFGIVERFGHADTDGSEADNPPAIAVSMRRIEPELQSQALVVSAGQVSKLTTQDDLEVLQWYSRLQRAQSDSMTRSQWRNLLAGRRLGYSDDSVYLDTRGLSVFENTQQASLKQLSLPGLNPKNAQEFEMIGIPLKEPGFHVLEIGSQRLGEALLAEPDTMYVRSSALVTNLGVHLKQGQDDVLVWVTTLDDAKPVAQASVRVMTCNGQELASGVTDAQGILHVTSLSLEDKYCETTGLSGLYVTARVAADHPQARGQADFSFALSGWDKGIEPWRFRLPYSWGRQAETTAHTVFDRSLFLSGETVHMKHYYVKQVRDGLARPQTYPDKLEITHQGSGKSWTLPLRWKAQDAGSVFALNEFAIPKDAPLGMYELYGTGSNLYVPLGQFRVEEFKLPLLKGQIKLSDAQQQPVLLAGEPIQADLQLEYVAGGVADYLPVQLSAMVQPREPSFAQYSDFTFSPVADDDQESQQVSPLFLNKKSVVLDDQGGARVQIDQVPALSGPGQYTLEATFADPNGEIQTITQTAAVWPAQVQAGLRTAYWLPGGKDNELIALALDQQGQPKAGVDMRVQAVKRLQRTTRKRLVGGFYSYDSVNSAQDLGTLCQGRSDQQGRLSCQIRFDQGGELELRVIARDAQGRESVAASRVWVSSTEQAWFGGENDDRIDIVPEKKVWAPGETARFQVRMPFREATALVSVEREGVLYTQVQQLAGEQPVAELTIRPEWGPNVYVSVLVLRGRLREVPWYSFFTWGWKQPSKWYQAYQGGADEYVAPNLWVDLSKPAFRFGVTGIQVSSQQDALSVQVSTDKPRYAIRETAQVQIQVKDAQGKPAAHASVAFAAVDQALLELSPNHSWDLLAAMRAERPYSVSTATAQSEVVGRRHYGRKALPTGGGGGKSPTRELLDTLLYWQGDVRLDEQGKASLTVPLNDALTRFTLVAVAESGNQRFGTGSAELVTSQDVQVISALPVVVREGDRYQAGLSLRNTSDRAMSLQVQAQWDNPALAAASLPAQTLSLEPGKAGSVQWEVVAPDLPAGMQQAQLQWTLSAQEQAGEQAMDSLRVTQQLQPAVPLAVQQATLLPLSATESLRLPIQAPEHALKDAKGKPKGGLELRLMSSLTSSLEGVIEWFAQYPYTCFEQQASRFMGMGDQAKWDSWMQRLPSYMDQSGLLRYFPTSSLRGSVVLTAYVLDISDEAKRLGWHFDIPQAYRQSMLLALQAYAQGQTEREPWLSPAQRDQQRLLAIETLSRYGMAKANMLDSIRPDLDNWPTSSVLDWLAVLNRVPGIEAAAEQSKQADQVLQARLRSRGTTLAFGDHAHNQDAWLMVSRASNQARLILQKLDQASWQEDLPRLLNGLLAEQRHGAWRMTTENLWGTLALRRFAQTQESEVSGLSIIAIADQDAQLVDWSQIPKKKGMQQYDMALDWPDQPQELNLDLNGEGRLWAQLRSVAAVPQTEPKEAGLSLERKVTPLEQAQQGVWSRGDTYKVRLRIRAQGKVNWAVLSDPVPAGAVILGSGLGRDSAIGARNLEAAGAQASFVERKFDVYRAYFDVLPEGETVLEYVVRLNTVGQFQLPASRIEALYEPDVFGLWPNNAVLDVHAAPQP